MAWGPPPWNSMRTLRPIEADGTSRYSTGRPGRENACAVPAPPVTTVRPATTTSARPMPSVFPRILGIPQLPVPTTSRLKPRVWSADFAPPDEPVGERHRQSAAARREPDDGQRRVD